MSLCMSDLQTVVLAGCLVCTCHYNKTLLLLLLLYAVVGVVLIWWSAERLVVTSCVNPCHVECLVWCLQGESHKALPWTLPKWITADLHTDQTIPLWQRQKWGRTAGGRHNLHHQPPPCGEPDRPHTSFTLYTFSGIRTVMGLML